MKMRVLSFCFLISLLLIGCDSNQEPYVFLTEYLLEYQVTGTATRANIEYQTLQGSYVEIKNVILPWNLQQYYYDFMVGAPVYLYAQSLNQSANVVVTINAKGVLYKQATSGTEGFIAVYGELP